MAILEAGRRIYDSGVASSRAVLREPPLIWSYSALKDVETCPRRYALTRADYPELWDKRGFPRVPVPAAIKGDIVHGALEIIVRRMVQAGCPSTRSPEAVAVLRELGGYTALAERTLGTQLLRLDGNPRVDSSRRQQIARLLTDWIPTARQQIQTYLSRMELSTPISATRRSGSEPHAAAPVRGPAGLGDHPEQELVADDLRMMGRVDLLKVATAGATITDFKTGAEDAAHHDQLRLYALLWQSDAKVNPGGLPVISLVAAYPSHEVAVPAPNARELKQLASDLRTRVAAADAAVATSKPEAVVGAQCGQCTVRVLCDAYWESYAPKTADVPDGTWFDLEGTVVSEHGVKSWIIRESRENCDVLVRTPKPSITLPVGKTVRILGARRTVDPDGGEVLIASLTSMSETFRLTD